jgi:hypothetical protein
MGMAELTMTTAILSDCPKWKVCPKKSMVLDKSYDSNDVYWVVMRDVCKKCVEHPKRR